MTLLTMDPDEFTDALEPGDLLLVDKMKLCSHVIEWIDVVPRSHCAIFDVASMIHCTRPGIIEDPIEQWTHDPTRTITALRHEDGVCFDVVDKALLYMKEGGTYDYRAFVALGPACFARSRHHPYDRLMSWASRIHPITMSRFTCSSFVYRCYVESGHRVEIKDPLKQVHDASPAWTVTPRDVWESPSFSTTAILHCQ